MAHVSARTREPLQCHSAQFCGALTHVGLNCQIFGCEMVCDRSIPNGAELNGSVYLGLELECLKKGTRRKFLNRRFPQFMKVVKTYHVSNLVVA